MTPRPQFKAGYRYEIIPSEGVFLLSETGQFLLRGEAYIQIAPLLDGQYTETEIIQRLDGHLSIAEVFYILQRLRDGGHLVDEPVLLPPQQAAFWDGLGIDSRTVVQRLEATTVSLIPIANLDTAPLQESLEAMGVRIGDDGDRAIVITDDYLRPELEVYNRNALTANRPWLLLKPLGTELWMGPIFIPGDTGCWHCLAHRLRGHRKLETYLEEKGHCGPFAPGFSALPSTVQMAFTVAATEIAQWIVCDRPSVLQGEVITLNALTLEKQHHSLLQRPQCPACGNPDWVAKQQSVPPQLQTRPKTFTEDGGHRSCSPEETYQKLAHHISPITGIISSLQPSLIAGDEKSPLHSYVANHNFALADNNLYFLHQGLRTLAGGKGKLEIQAKTSALCEAIERYSGVFRGDEARIRARYQDLETAIHPNTCMLFSDRQYQERDRLNAQQTRFNWIPEPFDETEEIDWTPVWSLTESEPRYLPTAYCYYGYSRQNHATFARGDSNGCAAGNSKEEAILQGFMELVERDSVALWWYNRLKKPAVDLSSFDEPYFQTLLDYYHSRDRSLWVLDITSDLNIPTFAAISARRDQPGSKVILAFGAHFDPQIGILRALTELNQFLPTLIAETPDHRIEDREVLEWLSVATTENQSYLTPDPSLPQKRRSDYAFLSSQDLYADVITCGEIVRAKGLSLLVLDQTRPDTGLHVVKTIVPGMRHFWARFAPGRLYEVPVQMGALGESLTEEQLNPIAMFL